MAAGSPRNKALERKTSKQLFLMSTLAPLMEKSIVGHARVGCNGLGCASCEWADGQTANGRTVNSEQ